MENLITEIRKRFNLTQVQMSADTGLNREFINKMEKGKFDISEKTIGLLKEVYKDNGTVKPRISDNSGLNTTPLKDEDNISEKKNDYLISQNETSVHSIIETNRNISRAIEKIADTNAQFAILLQSLIPAKTETYQGVHQDTLSKLSQILEYVVEIGSGKRWETKEDGIVELNKRFFGSSEVLQEKDTHSVNDK